jgi:hypothetical protein
MEPDFVSQTAEPLTPEQGGNWCRQRAREAERKGAAHHRFTFHPDRRILLYEGWKVRPDDEGEPRFQLESADVR